MTVLKKILSHNYWAILYFNFKMLPFQQAIKLPFDFYYKVRFENLSGKIMLSNDNIKRGMVKIGGRGSEMFTRSTTIIDVKGIINITGIVEIGHGCLIRVEKNGNLHFGNEVRIGALSKIFCENKIIFKNEIDFSWECQIFDTNFHYLRNIKLGLIDAINGEIEIGSYNWFGNRITVMKGTKTPNQFIVASNSLCNKSYLDLSAYSVVGGIPVKLIASNKQRVFENLEDTSKFLN
jgi:acetyltransferase-like isoleucine patch superfamily enzyme